VLVMLLLAVLVPLPLLLLLLLPSTQCAAHAVHPLSRPVHFF
jgi:hypothetical protein